MTFWNNLFASKEMILGLSPMDGVTDAPFRYMVAKYGGREFSNNKFSNSQIRTGVDIIFTEFVSVDALHFAQGERRERLLKTFLKVEDVGALDHKPYQVAQVFGNKPELFAEAAELIEKLGFDGIDINMGCPAHKVEENGSGAGLIRTPQTAQEIVKATKAATKLPVSVKTRIGVDSVVVEEWMEALMEVTPANISVHGRTLKQMYMGSADWEAIGRAAEIVHKHGGHILGNGDVMSIEEAQSRVEEYGVDGVLIGRAAEGNPAVFQGMSEPSTLQRMEWIKEHSQIYEKIFPENFVPMRKHLAWYCKGFPGAVELRMALMRTSSALEVQKILKDFFSHADRGNELI